MKRIINYNNFKPFLKESKDYEMVGKIYKILLTSELLPFASVDTYQGLLNPENMYDSYLYDQDEEFVEKFWDDFDHEIYGEAIQKVANNFFVSNVLPIFKNFFGKNIIVAGDISDFKSPKSYNYSSDKLYIDLYISSPKDVFNKLNEYLNEKGKTDMFDKWLKDTYKSYSGYISYMPKSIEDINYSIENDKDVALSIGAILSYILFDISDYDVNNATESIYYMLSENLPY
jgi:hypothetical protein